MEARKIIVKVVGYGQIKKTGGTGLMALRSAGYDPKAWDISLVKETKNARHYEAVPKEDTEGRNFHGQQEQQKASGAKLCEKCNGYYAGDVCPMCKAIAEKPPKMKTVYGDIVNEEGAKKEETAEFGHDLEGHTVYDEGNLVMTDASTGVQVSGPKKSTWAGDIETKTYRTVFTQALEFAAQVASGKGPAVVLSTVALLVEPDKITMQATDLELAFQRVLPATGGTVSRCVPAALLLSEIKALPENVTDVVLTFKENSVSVNGRADIKTSEADEFPTLGLPVRVPDEELSFIDGLVAGLKQVIPAASTDETRYVLTGILVDLAGKKVAATDGFRLHIGDIEPKPEFSASSIILPAKAAKLLVKHGASQHLTISDDGRFASFPVLGGVFRARLVEGVYPDYMKVIPTPDLSVTFSRKEFTDLVTGAKVLADKDSIDLAIGDLLTVKSASELGFYEWHLPCNLKGAAAGDGGQFGGSYALSFNLKFLLDAMRCYPMDTVTLRFPAAYGSALVNEKAVIMPIRR